MLNKHTYKNFLRYIILIISVNSQISVFCSHWESLLVQKTLWLSKYIVLGDKNIVIPSEMTLVRKHILCLPNIAIKQY